MNIFARIRVAWQKAVTSVVSLVETWKNDKPSYPDTNFENMVRHGWRKNELIHACITTKASTAAQVHMQTVAKGGEEPMLEHPLAILLQQPNPFMSEFDFWYITITFLDLAGRAVWEKQRDRAGRVIGLWPLRPDWCLPIQSQTAYIDGYEYTVPGQNPVRLENSDILEFKLFDPINPYTPWPPVAVAARIGDVDNAATDFIKLFFEKGAIPPAIIKTTQKLTDAQVEDIKKRWMSRYGGSSHWAEPAVLDKDAEYQAIGMTFVDMGFEVLDSRNEARICSVLHVPSIVAGAKVGLDRSTYTNYPAARRSWWEDVLIPLYTSFLDVIQNNLAPEFGPNVTVRWDFTGVIALREEQQMRWQRALEALKSGGITVNEYRREIGFAQVQDGDVFFRQNNFLALESPGEQAPAPVPMLPPTVSAGKSLTDRNREMRELQRKLETSLQKQKVKVTDALKEEELNANPS